MNLPAQADALAEQESELASHAPYPELPRRPGRQDDGRRRDPQEPRGLVERRTHDEIPGRLLFVPRAVAVAGHDAKPVGAGGQAGVGDLASCSRVRPLRIKAFEAIAEASLVGCPERECRVFDLEACRLRRHDLLVTRLEILIVSERLLDAYWSDALSLLERERLDYREPA